MAIVSGAHNNDNNRSPVRVGYFAQRRRPVVLDGMAWLAWLLCRQGMNVDRCGTEQEREMVVQVNGRRRWREGKGRGNCIHSMGILFGTPHVLLVPLCCGSFFVSGPVGTAIGEQLGSMHWLVVGYRECLGGLLYSSSVAQRFGYTN